VNEKLEDYTRHQKDKEFWRLTERAMEEWERDKETVRQEWEAKAKEIDALYKSCGITLSPEAIDNNVFVALTGFKHGHGEQRCLYCGSHHESWVCQYGKLDIARGAENEKRRQEASNERI